MKAKTTKFLAVLAVLAVAFAGCVVLLGEQNDAVEVTEVTKDTYPTNGIDAIASIELEDEADVKSVVLYDDSTVIEPTYAYFFADDADLFMSEDVLLSAPVMFFVLDGVELNIVAPTDKEFTDYGLIEFVFVKSYDDVNGIITLAEPKLFDEDGYAKDIGPIDKPNDYVSDANISYQKGDSFCIVADGEKAKKFVLGAIKALDLYGEGTEDEPAEFNLAGEIETVTIKTDRTAAVLTNFTGTVTDGTNIVELSGFTGKIVKSTNLILTGWVAGTLVSYKESETLVFEQIVFTEVGQYATFGKNVEIPVADDDTAEVKFTRYVRDNYTLNVGGALTAGSNGLTVKAGINGLEVSGSAVSQDAQLTFEGAAKVSGTFNADGEGIIISGNEYQITLENLRVDNGDLELDSEVVIQQQVTVNGNVTTTANVIVAPKSNFNVTQTFAGDESTTLLYVGKDATFRAQIVMFGDDTFTLGTEEWVDVAFVDGTGAIYLNQNKVTNTSSAVIAYLFQIGAGTVSINSSACSTPSLYYIYNQVIPYLSLNPVDVVCTSTIAEKAEISLDGVSYTGGELPIGNQARYTIDYSTGVPLFYVEFIELYKTYVLAAYDADGKQKIVIYDEDGNMVDMVKGAAEKTGNTTTGYTGIVKLAFNYDYTIQGINQYNKYTFTSKFLVTPADVDNEVPAEYETAIDFERLSTYASAFTMVRQELVTPEVLGEEYVAGDYGEIQYTEGLGMTLTVVIDDDDERLEVGDVLMYYTIVDEEGAEPQDDEAVAVYVTEDEDDNLVGVITNIYSSDTIFFKAADIEFYKLVVPQEDEEETTVENIDMDNTAGDILFSVKTWSDGYTFTPTKKTSTFPVSCEKNLTTVKFVFADNIPANQEITIDFSNYCGDASLHAKTIKLKETSKDADKEIQMCVGEVYTMTLKYIKKHIEDVLYPNPDYVSQDDTPTQPECLVYDGEAVTAKFTQQPFTYTVVYEPIIELEIVNKYSKAITMTVGDYSVDIAAGATGKLIVNQGYAGKTRTVGEPMELSMIGYDVKKWYYTPYTIDGPVPSTADLTVPILVDNSTTPDSVEDTLDGYIKKIDINDVRADRIVYLVKVDPIYQKIITYYDQSGYYETPMVAYVQPEFGEKTFGVEYFYEEDGVEIVSQATVDYTDEGEEFWAYDMPAHDVWLRPITAKPTYQVSFVDAATGEAVGEAIDVVPFTADPIDIPAKFGYVATAATTDAEIEGDLVFDAETQTVTFEMPTSEVVITVTYDAGGPYSDDMELFVSKTNGGVKITIIANDDLPIQSGYITIDYWYVYEEDGIYGMEQVVLDPVEFATSGAGVIESITLSLAEEEFFGAIYYVSATFEPIDGDAMKSDYIAYQMA